MKNLKSAVIGATAVAVSDFGVAAKFLPPTLDVGGVNVRSIVDGFIGAYVGAMAIGRKPELVSSLIQGVAAPFAANTFGAMLPLPPVGPLNLGRIVAGGAASYGVEALFGKDAVPG